jgi:hypothetical protein
MSAEVFRIEEPEGSGNFVLVDSCYCAEDKDETEYLIKWDDPPPGGLNYMYAHESCLRKVDD